MKTINLLKNSQVKVMGKGVKTVRILNDFKNIEKLRNLLDESVRLPFEKSKIGAVINSNLGRVFSFEIVNYIAETSINGKPAFYDRRKLVVFLGIDEGRTGANRSIAMKRVVQKKNEIVRPSEVSKIQRDTFVTGVYNEKLR